MSVRRICGAVAAVCATALMVAGCGDAPDGSSVAGESSAVEATPPRSSAPTRSSAVETTPPTLPPPYIEGVDWVDTEVGPSLQIRPTDNGRRVSGDGVDDEAWAEVLALEPDADTPGMRAQFDCHFTFARIVEPDKPSWNLEPDRPVVSEAEMIAARCNPGFAEE